MALEKITGIVTDVLKHSDRHNVITLYTREIGRIALLSPAGNGRSSRIRNASLLPLSIISADINITSGRDMQYLGRFQRETLWKDIYFNPVKSAISLFLSEFLNSYTRHSGPDPQAWDYMANAIACLDRQTRVPANFHLAFLIDFLSFAGIRPDMSERTPDSWFDMREGTSAIFPPSHRDRLSPREAEILPLLLRMNLRTASVFRFNAGQRRELLKGLLKYYGLHFPGLTSLKSPEILSELFV